MSEDAAVGQEVAVIKAFDPDKVSVISYQLINDTLGLFEIQADNGALILKRNLDRELLAVYDVQVRANDGVQFTDAIVNIQVCFFAKTGNIMTAWYENINFLINFQLNVIAERGKKMNIFVVSQV